MLTKVLFSLCSLAAKAFAAEPEMDEGVIVLTDANFDEVIAKHDHLLVEFYAPWCGHCQALDPEYKKAAQVLAQKDPPRYIAKIDTTVHENAGKRFNVEGFPTLKWFSHGKDSEYAGGRTEDTIVQWIMKKTGPAFENIKCDEVEKKVADSKLNLVYYGEQEGSMFEAFNAAAQAMDAYTFYATQTECAKDAGVHDAAGAAIFRTFDTSPVAYSGPAAEEDLQSFLKTEAVATLFEFDEDSVEPIFHEQKACVILLLDGDKPYKAAFEEASKELKGQILFSYSGVTEGIQEQLGEFIGVTADDLPTMRIIEPAEENVKKFKFEGDVENLTVEDVRKFITDFTDGKLKPFMKSDPVPEDNSGPVKVVVGHNFQEIVMDDTKDVLVKYYAPWCGHCQKLVPHWEKLGEHVKDIENLVIAKYDATTNENDEVQVEGFPTLTFYAAGSKEGVTAEGRNFNGLRKWLKANSEAYKSAFPD